MLTSYRRSNFRAVTAIKEGSLTKEAEAKSVKSFIFFPLNKPRTYIKSDPNTHIKDSEIDILRKGDYLQKA